MDDTTLLLADYQHFADSLWRNEETGEKRLNFFITLVAAVLSALAALHTSELFSDRPDTLAAITDGAFLGLLAYGLVTLLRIVQRDRVAGEYQRILGYIREAMRQRSAGLADYRLPLARPRHWLWRGGLAETVAVANGLLAALAVRQLPAAAGRWLVAAGVFAAALALQALFIQGAKKGRAPSSQTFRAGVGAVIVNAAGLVLTLERRDVAGAWQLPQGGLEAGETPLAGALREVREETGIDAAHLELIDPEPRLTVYELPASMRSAKTGRGQAQYWFLFRFTGDDREITLGDGREFSAWQWRPMAALLRLTAPFRVPVYGELAHHFKEHLGPGR